MNTIQKIFLIGLIPFMFFLGCEKEEYLNLNWIRYEYMSNLYNVHYRGDVTPPSSNFKDKCLWIHLYKSERYWTYHEVGSDDSKTKDIDDYSNVTYDER